MQEFIFCTLAKVCAVVMALGLVKNKAKNGFCFFTKKSSC